MGVITHRGINYPNSGSKVQNISEADYAALEQAGTVDPNTVYFRYELEDFGYEVQDDGTATDLIDGKVPTGRTIENVLNTNFNTLPAGTSASVKTFDNSTTSAAYAPTDNGYLSLRVGTGTAQRTITARIVDSSNTAIGVHYNGTIPAYASEAILLLPVIKGRTYSITCSGASSGTLYFTPNTFS